MLIDHTYFIGGFRRIANATLGVVPNPLSGHVREEIKSAIDFYVPRYLHDMFGKEWGEMIGRYVIDKDTTATTDEFLEVLCERMKEPCADYVFFYFMRDTVSEATITGVRKPKMEDTPVAPIGKQVLVWNDMVRKNTEIAIWLDSQRGCREKPTISLNMLTKINGFNI